MPYHHHLIRQLAKLGLGETALPEMAGWRKLLEGVSRSYFDFDRTRYTLERTIDLSQEEMADLNGRLVSERDELAQIFQAAAMGMIRVDLKGSLTDLNPAFEAVIGWSREDLVGKRVWELVVPEDRAEVRRSFEAAALGETPPDPRAHRLVKKGGEVVFTNIGLAVARDGGGPSCIIAVVENVTERNRLEVELRLSQRLESVGRLAAGVAHEINTPIQFVGDNVAFLSSAFKDLLVLCEQYRQTLAKAALGPVPAEELERVREAERLADLEYLKEEVGSAFSATLDGVGRVSHIVQSMKSFAHPDRGQRSAADLNAALKTTLTVATNELKYVARVETDLQPLPPVPCVLSDLNQVFLNLLVNAAHAIGDVVGKSGERGLIRVRSFQDGVDAVVAISDTGTGIKPEIRAKIFDPFFTTKEVGRGTGQGLALAHSVVVEQHGGSLTFETEVGKGTTFIMRIPLVSPSEEASEEAA